MNRSAIGGFVTILLMVAMVAGFCIYDTQARAWILPRSISSIGEDIDFMYKVILYVVLGMFLLTEVILIAFLVLYRERPGHRATYTHGNNKAEIVWTIIPGIMLFILAVWQKSAWTKAKYITPEDEKQAIKIELLAQQFTWKIRYPRFSDGVFATKDDYVVEKRLVVPVGQPVLFQMRSRDVIHSFFLPSLRVKQDVVPGMTLPAWFKATEPNARMIEKTRSNGDIFFDFEPLKEKDHPDKEMITDIACAELCGPQHYAMSGKFYVVTPAEYSRWREVTHVEVDDPDDGRHDGMDENKADPGQGTDWGWVWMRKTDW